MYEDSIKKLNEWFDDKENRSFDTGYNEFGEYSISQYDIDDFCNYLRENEPDLCYINIKISGGGIWFFRTDLESAYYY